MTGILLAKSFVASYGRQLDEVARRIGIKPEVLHLPDDPQARMSQADCDRIELTMQTRDVRFSEHFKSFGDALVAAKNLKWAHFHSTAIEQHVFVPPLLARGVKLTTSAGTNAEPVAHTAIMGLLMLARKFPHWIDAQRRHAWEPLRGDNAPHDLRGQTAIVVGLVAVTPAAGFVGPMSAIALGALAAFPSYFGLIIRARTSLDDSLDVVAAHGLGGTVGALLTGVFAQKAMNGVADGLLFGNPGQLGIQAAAVLAAIVYSGVVSFILLKVIGLVIPLRASDADEVEGLDISQHGEEAYLHAEGSSHGTYA